MALTKRPYVAHETIITAQNLNDIQDAIIDNENKGMFDYGGKDLSQRYTIAQLHELVAANNFKDIQIGDYYPITLNGTYHDAASDTDKTISNETVILEVAGINSYIREGDTELTTPHLCLISRDCLANTVQMRSENSTWYDGGDTENPWLGSAAYETLNNAEHGIVKLLEDAIGTGHIANMRYYAEKFPAGGSISAGGWKNRGKLWLPTESEVYGQSIHQTNAAVKYTLWNQLPLFAAGYRHIIKGSGNGGSRCYWWLSLATSATTFCFVGIDGGAGYAGAAYALRVPLCFLFT